MLQIATRVLSMLKRPSPRLEVEVNPVDPAARSEPDAQPRFVPRLLTGDGGVLSLSEGQRQKVALVEVGDRHVVQYVCAHDQYHHDVSAALDLAHLSGYELVDTKVVDHTELAEIYRSGDSILNAVAEQELLNRVIGLYARAARQEASDVKLVYERGVRLTVRYQIDGRYTPTVDAFPAEVGEGVLQAIFNTVADIRQGSLDLYGDQIAATTQEKARALAGTRWRDDFRRVSNMRHQFATEAGGMVLVTRLQYEEIAAIGQLSLGTLGFYPDQLPDIDVIIGSSTGVALICGPTGSGKTTTLKFINDAIYDANDGAVHVAEIADPPELPLKGASRLPVTQSIGATERSASYATKVPIALRLGIHALIVQEARDTETVHKVFEAALSSHLGMTTIHAPDALTIPVRLLELGAKPSLVFDPTVTFALLSQRLLPRLCTHCSLPLADATSDHRNRVTSILRTYEAKVDRVRIRSKEGCEHCWRGAKGRVLVGEVVLTDYELMERLRQGDRRAALGYLHERGGPGAVRLLHAAVRRIEEGLVDTDDVARMVGPIRREPWEKSTNVLSAAE